MCPCDCWLQQVAGALFLDSSVKEALLHSFVDIAGMCMYTAR